MGLCNAFSYHVLICSCFCNYNSLFVNLNLHAFLLCTSEMGTRLFFLKTCTQFCVNYWLVHHKSPKAVVCFAMFLFPFVRSLGYEALEPGS
jgi:hypothetical protein